MKKYKFELLGYFHYFYISYNSKPAFYVLRISVWNKCIRLFFLVPKQSEYTELFGIARVSFTVGIVLKFCCGDAAVGIPRICTLYVHLLANHRYYNGNIRQF